MKKKNLKSLRLNKNVISNDLNNVLGGTVPKWKIKIPSNTCQTNCDPCTSWCPSGNA
ncbi:hypothetical protein [uncultured Kordia sp.]|uniref:hypothetical protein n=1 Tax=uncultured Kordia sp. TaxID=507699 RepID=UPI00261E33DD|nr:hypothetical protein [uncultured Kordia sp.]